jgi:uncharacterized C2H2 Zn-finger protein
MSPDFLPGLIVGGVIVILFVALALLTRGKELKCPDCGTVFKAPAMDEKRSGLGWTIPYLGYVKCPKCGERRSRSDYQKVASPAPSPS